MKIWRLQEFRESLPYGYPLYFLHEERAQYETRKFAEWKIDALEVNEEENPPVPSELIESVAKDLWDKFRRPYRGKEWNELPGKVFPGCVNEKEEFRNMAYHAIISTDKNRKATKG